MSRALLIALVVVASVLTVEESAFAAPASVGAGPCADPDIPIRIPLVAVSDPPPDLSRLLMCTSPDRSVTVVVNSSDDVWLVESLTGSAVEQRGEVPAIVQAFRLFAVATSGVWLEPGTRVLTRSSPEQVALRIDKANQGRWSTFTLLKETADVAQENLPDLIKRKSYRDATSSCLAAGGSMMTTVAAARYNTATLVDYLGLGTGTTKCAADLSLAEKERQVLARLRTGANVAELAPSTFARRAGQVASYLDDLLRVAGQAAHI